MASERTSSSLTRSREESAGDSRCVLNYLQHVYNYDVCVENMYYDPLLEKMEVFERTITNTKQLQMFSKIKQDIIDCMQDMDDKFVQQQILISTYQSQRDIRSQIQSSSQTFEVPGLSFPSEQVCLAKDVQSQASASDSFAVDDLHQLERKIMVLEEQLNDLKRIKDSEKKKELSCIDFEAYKEEIPECLYRHVNDIKSTSACPCICVAYLINMFLSDAGYRFCLDLTKFLKVLNAITNIDEDLLRKKFCNPESEEGIDAFHKYLMKYLLDTKLIYEKVEDLKSVLDDIICKLKRCDDKKNAFMLGIGYKNFIVGHCINFYIKDKRMAVLDPQSGGHCKISVFEGVDDLGVHVLRSEFKEYVMRALPRKDLVECSDLLKICKGLRNAML